MARYPTTEEEDSKMMENRAMFTLLSANARNAIRLRRNEKRLLKRTIATAERRVIEILSGGSDDFELKRLFRSY
jgi:histone-lysine N-methyltransferase SETD3